MGTIRSFGNVMLVCTLLSLSGPDSVAASSPPTTAPRAGPAAVAATGPTAAHEDTLPAERTVAPVPNGAERAPEGDPEEAAIRALERAASALAAAARSLEGVPAKRGGSGEPGLAAPFPAGDDPLATSPADGAVGPSTANASDASDAALALADAASALADAARLRRRVLAERARASEEGIPTVYARGLALPPLPAPGGPARPTAQEPVLQITSGATRIDLGGRVQFQGAASSCSDFPETDGSVCGGDVPGLDLFARRVRLKADVTFSDFLDARLQPDFGEVDGVELKDAWGRLTFDPAFRVKIGHFKRPFDGFQLTSSTQILTIERDLDIPGVSGLTAASLDEFSTRFRLSDRDLGVEFSGRLPGLREEDGFQYWLGVFNGESPTDNEDRNTKKQFVGRAQYSLDLGGTPLAVAAAGAVTDLPFQTPEGELKGEYFSDFELWAELGDFDAGAHVQAGLIFGDNPLQASGGGPITDPSTTDFADMLAWQVIGSYRLPIGGIRFVQAVEPIFRITQANPDTDVGDDEVWGFTPGLQLFFDGRNKFALNWDFVVFAADALDAENSFKAQYQFHF